MRTAIAETQQENSVEFFKYPECTFTSTRLIIPKGMPFERWEALGRDLRKAGKGLQFWIGDWIRYGEHEYGEKYAQAIEATGKALSTLQNYVFVAQNVHFSRRRELDVVDFTTHAEVASLPAKEQERILAAAEKENLTVKQVRREASKVKRKTGKEKTEIEVLKTAEVKAFLEKYIDTLKQLETETPRSAGFLRNMVQAHIGQAQWQSERTVEKDCAVILEAIDEHNGLSDDELFTWLQCHGYFMRDPELDERLEYMVDQRMIQEADAGDSGKQENRRGKLPTFYTRWFKKWNLRKVEDEDEG